MKSATGELVGTSITGRDVWEAVLKDPRFKDEVEAGGPIMGVVKPFLKDSVVVLADLLETPITLQVLADSKIRFLKHSMANGFAEKMGEVTNVDLGRAASILEGLIAELEPMSENLEKLLAEQGITEAEAMITDRVGLNEENIRKWKSGTLTVADVLTSQPSVILKNDS